MNENIDDSTRCNRFHESLTPMMLAKVERLLFERFGITPLSVIPPNEMLSIYQQVIRDVAI